MEHEMIAVPANLVQAIGAYLAQRPYREVVEVLGALAQCQPVKAPAPPPEAVPAGIPPL